MVGRGREEGLGERQKGESRSILCGRSARVGTQECARDCPPPPPPPPPLTSPNSKTISSHLTSPTQATARQEPSSCCSPQSERETAGGLRDPP